MSITIVGGGNPSAPTFPVQRSVRLRSSASAYFNRTFGTATNASKWTKSLWIKRGTLGGVSIVAAQTVSASANYAIQFNADNTITWQFSNTLFLTTTQVFRDPSAWYHIVMVWDAANATAANRAILYINGVQVTAFVTDNRASVSASQNAWETAGTGYISYNNGTNSFDGYLTEVNFIDGQALTPTSFGAYNSYGVWSPAKYTGTYGTNGFYLNFQDNSAATAAAIGKDSSGNGNNWTPNNISVTAGVTYDSMLDVPTLTNANNANFAVMSPITGTTNLSNGNLYLTGAGAYRSGYSTIAFPSTGKWYWEGVFTQANNNLGFGAASIGPNTPPNPLPNTGGIGITNGGIWYLDTSTGTSGHTGWSAATVVGMTWDSSSNTFAYTVDGTTYNTVGSVSTTDGRIWAPAAWAFATNDQLTLNFGQRPFTYTPRSGYIALNTYNLPAPTIPNGAKYMAASLYTGTGAAQSITNTVNGVSMQPDFVWMKRRNAIDDHILMDSVRGVTKALFSNLTNAEVTDATRLTSFDSNGFTLGTSPSTNTNTGTYVGWQWKANGTPAVVNTLGVIPSTISANPTAGFSIVTYTGTGTGALSSVGHGLGLAPQMIILKNRGSVTNWPVYHANLTSASYTVFLNATNAQAADIGYWGNTPPDSAQFYIYGTSGSYSNISGANYVAYCFRSIAGYSKFGSYTGNGSADGPFVYLGFRPRFIMWKRTDTVGDWTIIDSSRSTYNVQNDELYPNSSIAESAAGAPRLDSLSNGFKIRNAGGAAINASGGTYIYACFAENPFNYSLAR